jgi:hypothetical protein
MSILMRVANARSANSASEDQDEIIASAEVRADYCPACLGEHPNSCPELTRTGLA